MFAVTSKALLAKPYLEEFLGARCLLVRGGPPPAGVTSVAGWGFRPSSAQSQDWARRRGLPFLRIEDGLIRSVGFGQEEPGFSLVVDDIGFYLDSTQPSRFEDLALAPLDETRVQRALDLMGLWREQRVSKYNYSREWRAAWPDRYVLVVDQTFGDASVLQGQASEKSFRQMLEAALEENPGASVLLKVHPEVLSGHKRGYFDLPALGRNSRIKIIGDDIHPVGLIEKAEAIYVVTSQMGFEGLIWQKTVRTFGLPFYAGWGITRDELPAPSRRQAIPLAQLAHAAFVGYSRYVDPETGRRCEPERVIEWMGFQRRLRERFPAKIYATGFSPWKKPILETFFQGSAVHHLGGIEQVPDGGTLVVWAGKSPPATESIPFIRVEDGFVRSVGLGAALIHPLSWVMDQSGIYYDATKPSDLETILATEPFPPPLLDRAARLRERIVRDRFTKYNLESAPWQPPPGSRMVILVPGQVETDASIRFGASTIRTNMALLRAVRESNPGAYLVYKPHPDVTSGLRSQGDAEDQAARWCDEIITQGSLTDLFEQIDEVHILTSLSGFEALLRGKKVVTYGQPFFAGWGLTTDASITPEVIARRARRLTLDELVAGVLILYPTYISRVTKRFTTPERALDELQEWRRQEALPLPLPEKIRRRILRLFSR